MAAQSSAGRAHRPSDTNTVMGLPPYVLAVAALFVVAIVVLVASSGSTGLQSCGSKALPQSRYTCFTYYAVLYGNASICSSLSGQYADQCLYEVALNQSDPAVCSSISSQQYRSECISKVSLSSVNASSCLSLSEPDASSCLYGVARAEGFANLSVCSQMQNATYALACSASYHYNSAVATLNPTECTYLYNRTNDTELKAVLSVSGRSQEFPTYSYYNVTPYGYCYSMVAYASHDSAACSSLSGSDAAVCNDAFLSNYTANYSQVSAYCSSATDPAVQSACLNGLEVYRAVSTRNASICLSLNQSFAYTCILDMAQHYNDTSYCGFLANQTLQSNCYMSAGIT